MPDSVDGVPLVVEIVGEIKPLIVGAEPIASIATDSYSGYEDAGPAVGGTSGAALPSAAAGPAKEVVE